MNDKTNGISEHMDKPKKKSILNGVFYKLKKIKHLDIILTVLFIAIILLIYFSSFSSNNKDSPINNNTTKIESTTISEYQNSLERKIEDTISAIKNAGSVKVMVVFSEGIETVIAYSTEKKQNKDGTTTEINSPVLITNSGKTQPIILQENLPMPTSIIVVATGAKDTNVKLEILRVVQAMFELNSSNIEIFAGN